MGMDDLDMPPEFEGEDDVPVPQGGISFHDVRLPGARQGGRGNPRNGYVGQVDKIKEALIGAYQDSKDYGEFLIEVKRKSEADNKWKQCGTYENLNELNMPTPKEIGMRFGGGSYLLIARYTDANEKPCTKQFSVELDKEYDKFVKPQGEAQQTQTQGDGADRSVDNLAKLMQLTGLNKNDNTLLTETMKSKDSLVETILKATQENKQQFTPQDAMTLMQKMAELNQPKDKMSEMIEAVSKIVEANKPASNNNSMELMMAMMKNQMDMFMAQSKNTTDMLIAMMANSKPLPPSESTADRLLAVILPSLLDKSKKEDPYEQMTKMLTFAKSLNGNNSDDDEANKLVEMILPYIPMLLQKTVDALTVRALLKSLPEYQTLQQNPALMGKVATMLEDRLEPEVFEQVMEKTGLNQAASASLPVPPPPQADGNPDLPPANTAIEL